MNETVPSSAVRFREGRCHVLFAFDIGQEVDLAHVQRAMSSAGAESVLHQNRRAPHFFDYKPPPIRLTQQINRVPVGTRWTGGTVDVTLYDFGAAVLRYEIPCDGGWGDLQELSAALIGEPVLQGAARQTLEKLAQILRKATRNPAVSDLIEDYQIFEMRDIAAPCAVHQLHQHHGSEIARILRAEQQALSPQEVRDALSCRISYGLEDVAFIDWNAALIVDRDADDVRAVLEFANLELLEMRFLDRQLDEALDRSYAMLTRSGGRWLKPSAGLRQVGQLQMDGAILFERVSNAIKLMGDQYLARVYRLASGRFHLPEWNAGILRKLDTIDNLYEKISDRNANRRLELLEWIIIILIAYEIIQPFLPAAFRP